MRISALVMPLSTLFLGLIGFSLRLTERRYVFDVLDLPERGAVTTHLLFVATAIFITMAFAFCQVALLKHRSLQRFDLAFGTNTIFYPFATLIVGILWAIGTSAYFAELHNFELMNFNNGLFIFLSVFSIFAVVVFPVQIFQDTVRKQSYAICMIPVVFLGHWLIVIYSENLTNPILLSYAYQIVAIVSAILSFFFTAYFLYRKPVSGVAVMSYLFTIYFGMVILADGLPMGMNLIIIAIVIHSLVHSFMLINSLVSKRAYRNCVSQLGREF